MCNTCGCSAAEEINPVESVVVPAPLGRGVAQFYSEGGDMATYAPSEEAEGSTPATEPTNANFSAESKSMFGKDKNGRMYARRRNGRIITHNAETIHEKGDYRIIAEDDDTWDKNWTDSAKEMAEEYGVYTLKVQKKVMGGWETIDGLSGVIAPDYGADSLKDFALSDMILPEGVDFDAESFNAEAVENEIGCDNCGRFEKLWSYANFDLDLCAICSKKEGFRAESGNLVDINFDAESLNAESKSMFGKDKNGRMYARRRNGRIITHNAEHEGLYACSKCKHWNRNPVDDITKCKKCGNETFTFVKRSEFMPEGDGNVVGQQTFGFNGTPLHAEEDTSFGLVGEGNDFGQMRAEDDDFYYCSKCDEGFSSINPTEEGQFCDSCLPSSATLHDEMERITMDADYALEKPFTTGAKLSAGLLTGAALFGVVGASLTALLGSMMGRGE